MFETLQEARQRRHQEMLQTPVTIPAFGTTYGNWKGITGPGAMLTGLGLNPQFRPGFRQALDKAYRAYCESDECPDTDGPCPIRAAKYKELAEELTAKHPSVEELQSSGLPKGASEAPS